MPLGDCESLSARLTRSSIPFWRSYTKTSSAPFVSAGTTLSSHWDSNATHRPSADRSACSLPKSSSRSQIRHKMKPLVRVCGQALDSDRGGGRGRCTASRWAASRARSSVLAIERQRHRGCGSHGNAVETSGGEPWRSAAKQPSANTSPCRHLPIAATSRDTHGHMVKRGSTVRVRQRALLDPAWSLQLRERRSWTAESKRPLWKRFGNASELLMLSRRCVPFRRHRPAP